jgi:cytoskeletal protein RodZ
MDALTVSGNRPQYDDYPRGVDETERFSVGETPSPWYLKRWVLALWGLAVVMLIAVIIYGLAILARGNGGNAPTPTTTPTSTPTSSHTTTPSTTPSTTEPTETTTTEVTIEPAPPPSATWTQHPRRHWWRSNLPPIPHF